MTSNAGVENLSKTATIGFTSSNDLAGGEEEKILAGLKKRFRPEFINRIDNIVVFNSLSKDDVAKITKLQIGNLARKMDGVGISLRVEDEVVTWLVEKGYQPEYGARPMRRLIQTELEDPIAEAILSQDKPKSCVVTLSENKPKFSFA